MGVLHLARQIDLSLFHVPGNALEWCQEKLRSPGPGEDAEQSILLSNEFGRVLRGGSFLGQSGDVRSAARLSNRPDSRSHFVGLRPARTLSGDFFAGSR
jgi:formylglycine-generating enzyme required for sulfatase activity